MLMIGLCVTILFFLLYTGISWYLEYKESEITVNEVPVLEKKLESLDTPWSGVSKPLSLMLSCMNAVTEKRVVLLLYLDGCQNQLRPAMREIFPIQSRETMVLVCGYHLLMNFFPHMNILTSAIYQKMRCILMEVTY